MNKKAVVITLCVAAVLGSLAWIYFNAAGRPPRIQLDPYRALGEVAGEETGRLLNHKGEVVVIARDEPGDVDPVEVAQLKWVRSALQKQGVRLAAIETFTVPPRELFQRGSVPHARFFQVLRAHPHVGALVVFAGLPQMDQTDLNTIKESGVKIVLVCGFKPGDQALLNAGVINLAIVPRGEPPSETSKPSQGTRGLFDRHYVILAPLKKPGAL